jgi:transposase InsO family protein
MQRQELVTGMNVSAEDFKAAKKKFCEPCILGKHTKHSFQSTEHRAEQLLELTHMDLEGPVEIPSLGGGRYVATFLDDYSKYSTVMILKSKAEVPGAVKKYIAVMEKQTGLHVKKVRTDRGTEYLNQELTKYYDSKGIVHELTAAYTPQHNGSAERHHMTLWEMGRAMMQRAELGPELWAEAIATASILKNKSPAACVDKTPWELMHGKKPDISNLRVWGSTVYARVPEQKRKKLDARSEKGIFVGYDATNPENYRVLFPNRPFGRDNLQVCTHVKFIERQGECQEEEREQPVVVRCVEEDEEGDNANNQAGLEQQEQGEEQAEPEGAALQEAADEEANNNAAEDVEQGAHEPRRSARLHKPQPSQAGEDPGAEPEPEQELRRSTRARQPPKPMYVPGEAKLGAVSKRKLPSTLDEARQSPEWLMWKQAMDDEMQSLLSNETWELKQRPKGVIEISCRWVFAIKEDALGNIERYKARLVAKGFMQEYGVDYIDIFAPVSKHASLRALLSIVATEDLDMDHIDYKTAFLNGDLEEEVHMVQPPGYEQGGADTVCYMKKALYGLKQAPRAWHTKLKQKLEELGFTQTYADPALWYTHVDGRLVFVLVYVDDLLVAGKRGADNMLPKKRELLKAFPARDLGAAHIFLGLEITRDRAKRTLTLSQGKYTREVIEEFRMTDAYPVATPMNSGVRLTKEGQPLDTSRYLYSKLVGALLYLSVCTRPDIAQAVGALSRYMAKPTEEHWKAAKHVLRYLCGTVDYGLHFGDTVGLEGYCDADYASDLSTRRSTTGFVFMLNGGPICWSSKLQPTVAASTTEAEYMAAHSATKEGLWVRTLLKELGYEGAQTAPLHMRSDSQGALSIITNDIVSARSKHIDVQHHFVRERAARGEVSFHYCKSRDMVADALTKPLPRDAFAFCREGMGVRG